MGGCVGLRIRRTYVNQSDAEALSHVASARVAEDVQKLRAG